MVFRLSVIAILCLIVSLNSAASSEIRFEDQNRVLVGSVDDRGRVRGRSGATIGYISGAAIQNVDRGTIGFVTVKGRIEDVAHKPIAFVDENGRVTGVNHSTVGFVRENGRIENADLRVVGYVSGNNRSRIKETAAIWIFFFGAGNPLHL